jgi:hypothetical protein
VSAYALTNDYTANRLTSFAGVRDRLTAWIGQASRYPVIGLTLGSEPRLERYDPIAIGAVSARSLRDALERLARYKQLVFPEELRVVERGGECRVQFRWLLAEQTEPPVLVDVCFARVLEIARRGTGEQVAPKRLEVRGSTGKPEMYEAHFGCPVKLDARENTLVFARAAAEAVTADSIARTSIKRGRRCGQERWSPFAAVLDRPSADEERPSQAPLP